MPTNKAPPWLFASAKYDVSTHRVSLQKLPRGVAACDGLKKCGSDTPVALFSTTLHCTKRQECRFYVIVLIRARRPHNHRKGAQQKSSSSMTGKGAWATRPRRLRIQPRGRVALAPYPTKQSPPLAGANGGLFCKTISTNAYPIKAFKRASTRSLPSTTSIGNRSGPPPLPLNA